MKYIKKTALLLAIIAVSISSGYLLFDYDRDFKAGAQFQQESDLRRLLYENPQIVRDLLWTKDIQWLTFFESLDGYDTNDGSGTVTTSTSGTQITFTTTGNSGEFAEMLKKPQQQGFFTFSQPSRFRTNFNLATTTAVQAWFVHGSLSGQGYGFKVINNSLLGFTRSAGGVESTSTLQTISGGFNYNIEARYEPSGKVIFLADDPAATPVKTIREIGVLTSNLPANSSSTNTTLLDIKLRTTENVAKTMTISFFQYDQARNIMSY